MAIPMTGPQDQMNLEKAFTTVIHNMDLKINRLNQQIRELRQMKEEMFPATSAVSQAPTLIPQAPIRKIADQPENPDAAPYMPSSIPQVGDMKG